MRESAIERYLVRRVKAAGGECRKYVTPGRRHAPDRLVLIPRLGIVVLADVGRPARVVFAELKMLGKRARAGQKREHKRLRDMGFEVRVIDSKTLVDRYVKYWFGGLDGIRK